MSDKKLTDLEEMLLNRPKSLKDFYQTALDANSEEIGARFRHAFETNAALKNENLCLRESVDALIVENRELREKVDKMRAAAQSYVSHLQVAVGDAQNDRDRMLIEIGYLRAEVALLRGEK